MSCKPVLLSSYLIERDDKNPSNAFDKVFKN